MKTITKEELEELYNSKSNIEVCEILGIAEPTLLRYLKSAGIELKGKGGGQPKGPKKKVQVVY